MSDWRRLNVMLTRARRGCIVIGSRRMLLNDPLWHQWLLWAAARGAIVGEAQRGAWQPRYLVDDRDGMWTVKVSIAEEPVKALEFTRQITPEQVKAEVVDCWEDLGSPVASPSSHAAKIDDIPPVNLEASQVRIICNVELGMLGLRSSSASTTDDDHDSGVAQGVASTDVSSCIIAAKLDSSSKTYLA